MSRLNDDEIRTSVITEEANGKGLRVSAEDI